MYNQYSIDNHSGFYNEAEKFSEECCPQLNKNVSSSNFLACRNSSVKRDLLSGRYLLKNYNTSACANIDATMRS